MPVTGMNTFPCRKLWKQIVKSYRKRGRKMDKFTFSYPAKVYFGEGSAAQALDEELSKVGEVVMLAYGGGSIKKCCGETVPVIFSEFIIDFVFCL